MSFNDFTLLPADDPQSTPAADLAAAVQGALTLPDVTTPVNATPADPLGRSWPFDWEAGQFIRQGQSPGNVSGLDAVAEWCLMAMHSARFAHPTFSDEFGMEHPESVVGEFATGETLADWQRHLIEALMVHDRVTSIQNLELRWDPTQGVLYIDQMDVVTDEDKTVTVSDVALTVGGAG